MSTATTAFRKAIRDAVAAAADVPSDRIVDRWVDAPQVDESVVCSMPGGWRPNEENRFFRLYTFAVRLLLPADPTVGPVEDDRADALEEAADVILAALPQSPDVGSDTEWIYYVDEVAFDVAKVCVDFSFTVELENPGEF